MLGLNTLFFYIDITDIQGADWKKPRFRTHAKMRWDDKYLYIGAFLQETDVWANQTKHDSVGKYQTKINLGKILISYLNTLQVYMICR